MTVSIIDRDVLLSNFSANLKRLREKKGLSINGLAREAKVAVMNISRFERALHVPGLDQVLAIAEALDVAPQALWEDAKLVQKELAAAS